MAAVKKVGQKYGEIGLLVEYLFCALDTECDHMTHVTVTNKKILIKVILIYFPGNLLILFNPNLYSCKTYS